MADREVVRFQRARHARCQRPGLAQLRDRPAVAHEHVTRRRRWRGLAAVDRDHASIRQPDQEEAAAADPRVVPVHHAKCQRGGDGGVDRVAAALHCRDGGVGGQWMHGRRHPMDAARDFAARADADQRQ